MTTFTAPLDDLAFVLHDVLGLGAAGSRYADLGRDVTDAVLAEAGRLAQEVLHPLNATGDRQGCRLEGGVVHTPDGFRDAYGRLCAGGWTGLACAQEHGGQGMPYVLHTAVNEIFAAANMALNMYPGLSHGAYSAILAHGTAAQRKTWLPPLASGAWTGTMNLTEPHCGTDLGLVRTKAAPAPDGSYRITGQKIFISAGDHDLTDNIVHLVLARAPGGGEGTRGLSLFIVPKFTLGPDGEPQERNALAAGKIESKMGIHGNATCVMNYDGARGELLGDLHKGMQAMFTMMNEARLGVGLQGYAIAEVARQNALAYARERLQGRAVPAPAFPDRPADPLIVHPDIRRMLMDQKSFVEGARALTLWGATLIDGTAGGDEADAEMIGLLTPVIKAFLTDKGFEACVSAQQVWGGHGYIEENGMAQFVRDARITQIYEGANGIQALDLVGRKLAHDGGKALRGFLALVEHFAAAHASDPDDFAAGFLAPLKAATDDLTAAALHFMEEGGRDPDLVLAGSTDFLHLFGHVALGFMWARMAAVARAARTTGGGNARFLEAKLATGRYYMAQHLPATALHLARIAHGGGTTMALAADDF